MLDEEILQWLMERREQELAISILMLQAYPRAKITPINPSFKASDGWAHKFMKRHKLVLRARTSMAQKLPGDLENRIVSFYSSVRKTRLSNDFPVHFIGNMDETPVYFDTVPGKTLHTCGAKTIKVRTTGAEKRHLTVVLSCTILGEVLRPKGWMDEIKMGRWIYEVWAKYTKCDSSLLVLDAFRGHITESVYEKYKETNTTVCVIPGGCTSILQL